MTTKKGNKMNLETQANVSNLSNRRLWIIVQQPLTQTQLQQAAKQELDKRGATRVFHLPR